MSIITEESKNIISKINFEFFKNKKVLITGASGLIGIYLISCLKQLSYNIEIYAWVKNEISDEIKPIFNGCNIIQEDITESKNIDNLPFFDCIIHSAGYGQPDKFLENKLKTINLNTTITMKLFTKLNKNGKFLFVSTSELYSGLNIENITENQIGVTNTDHPRACYIEGKRCGETICMSYKEIGYDVKIIRLSLAYGPGTKKNDKRVLNSLIEKGLKLNKISLLDMGTAVRTYCYITDVIEMFWNILLFGKDTLYNVGGQSKLSIYELSLIIGDVLNKPIELPSESIDMPGNPKIVNISNKKYIDEFGKTDFIDIKTGIKNTIKWQKQIYNE